MNVLVKKFLLTYSNKTLYQHILSANLKAHWAKTVDQQKTNHSLSPARLYRFHEIMQLAVKKLFTAVFFYLNCPSDEVIFYRVVACFMMPMGEAQSQTCH